MAFPALQLVKVLFLIALLSTMLLNAQYIPTLAGLAPKTILANYTVISAFIRTDVVQQRHEVVWAT